MKTIVKYILETKRQVSLNTYIKESFKINKDTKFVDQEEEINNPEYWYPDDILCGTWSYTMTIPYFYKILKRTAKSFTIVELPKKLVSGHYNSYHFEEVPDETKPIKEKPKTVRINKFGHLVVDKVHLHKWDGKPLSGDDMD